jgi:hypothetical protein
MGTGTGTGTGGVIFRPYSRFPYLGRIIPAGIPVYLHVVFKFSPQCKLAHQTSQTPHLARARCCYWALRSTSPLARHKTSRPSPKRQTLVSSSSHIVQRAAAHPSPFRCRHRPAPPQGTPPSARLQPSPEGTPPSARGQGVPPPRGG